MTIRELCARLREAGAKATPGPWRVRDGGICLHVVSDLPSFETGCIEFDGRPSADFIALSRSSDALAAWAEEAAKELRGINSDCQCFKVCPKCEGATELLSRFDAEIGGGR